MISNRLNVCGVSIDATTTGPIKDNALHIVKIDQTNWLISTHICDVPYIIQKFSSSESGLEQLENSGSNVNKSSIFPIGVLGDCLISSRYPAKTITISMLVSATGEFSQLSINRTILNLTRSYSLGDVNNILSSQRRGHNQLYEFQKVARILAQKRQDLGGFCGYSPRLGYFDISRPNLIETEAQMIVKELRLAFDHALTCELDQIKTPLIFMRQGTQEKIDLAPVRKRFNQAVLEDNLDSLSLVTSELKTLLRPVAPTCHNYSAMAHTSYGFKRYAKFLSPVRSFWDLLNLRQLLAVTGLGVDCYSTLELDTYIQVSKPKSIVTKHETEKCRLSANCSKKRQKPEKVVTVANALPEYLRKEKAYSELSKLANERNVDIIFMNHARGRGICHFDLEFKLRNSENAHTRHFSAKTPQLALKAAFRSLRNIVPAPSAKRTA